ncbi:hypothetical protein [Herbaspirillum sp. NPDC087042]|uniref:hypothetical protein n=1 Tax=Herbaspirillum sp. NPDC087042 TaxID=3364004 RepID=UPI00382FB40D
MTTIRSRVRHAVTVFLALAWGICAAGHAHAQRPAAEDHVIEIKLADLNDDNPLINYRKALLELALKASGRRYTISGCQLTDVATSDLRYAQLIKSGQYCNLLATSAGGELTQGLLPIQFPIYLGGGGYRVLLANRKSLAAAKAIRSLDDLRKFSIGSGIGWVDTSIMQANGLAVVQNNYMNLFEMLKAGRFDFYNRSVFEVAGELDSYDARHELAIVPDLVLVYPEDLFFYTSPNREDIRDAVLDGLRKIHRNGELAELIRTHSSTRNARALLQSAKGRVLMLDNARLTPLERQAIETYRMDWFK